MSAPGRKDAAASNPPEATAGQAAPRDGAPKDGAPKDGAPKDAVIVRAAVHPGIGIARLGNSRASGPDGFYIGPEVTHPPTTPADQMRDSSGAVKRQAARFRVYGYNAAGQVVRELDADNAEIQWTVHLANRKAEWYAIKNALDIPENKDLKLPRRNPKITGEDRHTLVIDPGPRTITGKGTSGDAYRFDGGTFLGAEVPLGELRTDEAGRLLVLGGFGASGSPTGKPVFDADNPFGFNNADGWFDDVSDGPVDVEVILDGHALPVTPAWVAVAPPNYAPDLIGWRTMDDLVTDLYIQDGRLGMPEKVSFTRHVLPIFQRMSRFQWVNKSFAAAFGHDSPMDFDDPTLVRKLATCPSSPSEDPWKELRRTLCNSLRPPTTEVFDPRAWPWLFGDDFTGSVTSGSPRLNLFLSAVQTRRLRRWVEGDFIDDWDPSLTPPSRLDEVPTAEQPAMLDRAALHFCLAHAFNPGSELTWIMRHSQLFEAPYRIRRRATGSFVADPGSELTQEEALAPGGPLSAQRPGDLTRWMALPWQMDAAWCRAGFDDRYDPYAPTFWVPRVPNQVLTEKDYETAIDPKADRHQRLVAFNNRQNWLRSLSGDPAQQIMDMVENFGKLGIVEKRPGVDDDPDLPTEMWVENL